MAASFICCFIAMYYLKYIPADFLIILLPPVIVISVIGFWDDHGHIPAYYRLLTHIVAVTWLVTMAGEGMHIYTPFGTVTGGVITAGFVGFFLVWFINLYNFMDGIDAIAASEAMFIALGSAVIVYLASGSGAVISSYLLLAAVSAGFLVWNWPPAKIFMGDIGSGFIGIVLSVLAYLVINMHGEVGWAMLILPAVFVTDASVTLFRRMLRGESWYKPHRSHAYQRASLTHGHKAVVTSVIFINIAWVFPAAYLAYLLPDWGVLMAIIAYTPLVACSMYCFRDS